jgi:hypothetical protein
MPFQQQQNLAFQDVKRLLSLFKTWKIKTYLFATYMSNQLLPYRNEFASIIKTSWCIIFRKTGAD